jgi:hypothetical protein
MNALEVSIMFSQAWSMGVLLEETTVDILRVDSMTKSTYFHLACRYTTDILVLESLLISLR